MKDKQRSALRAYFADWPIVPVFLCLMLMAVGHGAPYVFRVGQGLAAGVS